ncbi:hypothetical protein [Streptomyces sp. B6B3]|uniref:hypothetical protein n=1 Tax=Streptomyces sp. B6B3 TaxID=3153570 RepID=UPI00325E88EA
MPRKPMPDIPRDEAVGLYRDGRSMAALGRRYGVSAMWLAARFREWGEPVRGRREAQRVRMGMSPEAYRRHVDLPP